ncbi:hypothetical protein SADUNF_Sadunf05G0020500 [Salix dunnii]|uniref:RING-type E3 ubiquitin transferase n=1 Tax=Salix dunnii TaxID=1413687 RepID=A0A835K0F5_9ROSI|nr:hypothetical protein SADUNF_Sadunf05G0020500 [Salix dunnii]
MGSASSRHRRNHRQNNHVHHHQNPQRPSLTSSTSTTPIHPPPSFPNTNNTNNLNPPNASIPCPNAPYSTPMIPTGSAYGSSSYPPPPPPPILPFNNNGWGAYNYQQSGFMGPPLQPSTQVRHHSSGLVQPPRYVEHNQAKTIKNAVNVNKASIKVFADENSSGSHLVSFTFDAVVDGRLEGIGSVSFSSSSDYYGKQWSFSKKILHETFSSTAKSFKSKLVLNGYGNCLKKIGALISTQELPYGPFASITIFYFAKEGDNCTFVPVYPEIYVPKKIPFEKGVGQKFSQPSGTGIDLGFFELDQLSKPSPGEDIYPLVIFAEASSPSLSTSTSQEPEKPLPPMSTHAQITEAFLDINNEGHFEVKVVKQILWIDGIHYELREIFGIANSDGAGVDETDSGKECIICMTEPKDTAVLPCRHMCLCSGCAKELRSRSDRCPICRQPIQELMEIKLILNKEPVDHRVRAA